MRLAPGVDVADREEARLAEIGRETPDPEGDGVSIVASFAPEGANIV
jgi:hypothetical protein